jgi:hypothetical protein
LKKLGYGSWHVALPKLQKLSAGELKRSYPLLNLRDLADHVKHAGRRHDERKADRAAATTLPLRGRSHMPSKRAYERCHLQEADHSKRPRHEAIPSTSSHQKEKGARRNPGQSEILPRSSTRPITGGTLVSIDSVAEHSDDSKEDESSGSSEDSRVSLWTVIASDESEASIYGLRSALHEADSQDMEDGELSDSSSHENPGMPMAERDKVIKWRADNMLEDNQDFAYFYTDFEEAYRKAGRAVAMSWSRSRALAVPGMSSDMAKVSKVEATVAKIRRVDDQRKHAETKAKPKKMPTASFLRQPGKGAEVEEEEADKTRFIQPLAQLMMNCKVGREGNTSATDEEIMKSLVRRATRVVKAAETPTLQRAITTADEIVKYLASKEKPMEISSLEPLALEHFLHESQSQVRAVNAVNWLNKNLQLGWPLDKVEKPCVKKTSHIGMECNQALTAQPGMLQALEVRLIAAAEADDPTWLAPVASWLQAMGNLRLVHVTRRSVPVELFREWILFFCKRGKQQHNRSGFYWGVPRMTKGVAGKQDFKRDTITVPTVEEASNLFGGTFCANCIPLLRASLALDVRRCYR